MLLAAIALLIQTLPLILAAFGVVSPAMQALIEKLGAAIPALIVSLSSGGGITSDIVDILGAFQTEIETLQTNTALDPEALALAKSLDGAIQEALTAYQAAASVCDPSTLTPLPVIW